ncbi:MAG: YdcF family protein [Comamonadaceae bacterium]|nr:MAG: YdcF family protein [Comamonadaceae bacterium]
MSRMHLSSWVMLTVGGLLLLHCAYLVTVKVTHFGVMVPAAIGACLVALGFAGDRWGVWLEGQSWRVFAWRAGLVLFGLWLLTVLLFFGMLQRLKDAQAAGAAPQAIVVLGSSTPGGQPSPALEKRLDKALEIAKVYPSARVITSGGVDFGETQSEGEVMAAYLRARGLAGSRVLVEDRSTSTQENLVFSLRLLQAAGIGADAPALLVTSDFHTLRAGRIARKAGWLNMATAGAVTPLYMRYNAWLREYFACLSGWLLREY